MFHCVHIEKESDKHTAGLSYLPSDMAGIILSHEPEVSPCVLHGVATPRRWVGQRHRWLIPWEAQINKTRQAHLLQTFIILPNPLLKCKIKAEIIRTKLQRRRKSWSMEPHPCPAVLVRRVSFWKWRSWPSCHSPPRAAAAARSLRGQAPDLWPSPALMHRNKASDCTVAGPVGKCSTSKLINKYWCYTFRKSTFFKVLLSKTRNFNISSYLQNIFQSMTSQGCPNHVSDFKTKIKMFILIESIPLTTQETASLLEVQFSS